MSNRSSSIRKSIVVIGMVIPIVLLIGLGVIVRQSQKDQLTSSNWVSHTLEVESKLVRLQSLVADAVAAERGYLLTQRAEYLPVFEAAVAEISQREDDLIALTADNAAQQERLENLHTMIAARTGKLKEVVALAQSGRRDEALAAVKSDAPMTEIREGIVAAVGAEEALLRTRQEALVGKSALNTQASFLLIVFAAVTVGVALWLLRRMQKVQALVTVCAWSKTVELEGEWVSFEEYLQKRFGFGISHGISPEEAVKFRRELEEEQQKRKEQANRKAAA